MDTEGPKIAALDTENHPIKTGLTCPVAGIAPGLGLLRFLVLPLAGEPLELLCISMANAFPGGEWEEHYWQLIVA